MALQGILAAAARRRTTTLLAGPLAAAAASSSLASSRRAVVFPFGVAHLLPSRVVFFPEQRIPVRIHVAAARISSAAGEEGKKLGAEGSSSNNGSAPAALAEGKKLGADGSSSNNGSAPAALAEVKRFIDKQLSEHSRDHALMLIKLFDMETSDRRQSSRQEVNRQLIYTILVALAAFVLDGIRAKKAAGEQVEAAGSGTGSGVEKAADASAEEEVGAAGSGTGSSAEKAADASADEVDAAGSGTGTIAATGVEEAAGSSTAAKEEDA